MKRLRVMTSVIIILNLIMLIPVSAVENAAENDKRVIYVDQANGSDSASGFEGKPVKTLKRAQNIVRGLSKDKPIEVVVASGSYAPLSFTDQDSGKKSAPVTYKAAEGAEVVISGAKKVDLSGFKKVEDPDIISRIQEQAYPYIGQIELLKYGFTKQELDMIDEQANAYYINPVRRPVPLLALFNGVEQTIAEYPNNGEYMKVTNVTVPGAQGAGQSYEHWVDDKTRATFKYTDPRVSKWTKAKDIFVEGFIGVDWAQDKNLVRQINTNEGTLTFSEASNYRLKDGDRIRFMNFIEELDLPGEWVIDQESYIMYFYPPYKVNPQKDNLELVISEKPLIDFQRTAYVTIEGFILKNNKGYGVNINYCDNVNIKKCIIRNISSDGIFVKGRDCLIEGNQILYTTNRGINVSGEDEKTGTHYKADISKPNSIKILNNYFYKTTMSATEVTHINNVGFQFKNNLAHNIRKYQGVRYQGIDGDVSYNELCNILREVGDQGPIYAGRQMGDFGNVVSYNYVHDYGADYESDEAISGIYWDDYQSGQTGINNILVPNNNQITYATHLASGSHNTLKYNITVNSMTGIMAKDRNEYGGVANSDFTKQEAYINAKKNITDSILQKYPAALDALEYIENHETHAHAPLKNVITDNFTVNVETDSNDISESIAELGTVENNTIVKNGTDLKEIFVDADNHDFRIKNSAMEKYKLSDKFITESNFDMEEIGIQNSVLDMTDKKDDFRLIYPANGAENIPSNNVTLKWEQADYSDYYYYEVAKDPEFNEVVISDRAPYSSVNIGKLPNGESFYWRVKAMNITREMGKEWECIGGPYLFTITEFDKTDKSILKKTIDKLTPVFEANYEESDQPGEYKIGTNATLKKILSDAIYIYGNSTSTQEQIDGAVEKLTTTSEILDGYKNIGYKTLDLSGNDAFSAMDPFSAVYNDDSVVIGEISSTVAYKHKISGAEVLKFRMKLSFDSGSGWYGFTLKKSNPNDAVWVATTYLLVVKKDTIEFQKYYASASKTGIILEKENDVIKPDEWYEMEFGAVETPDGVYVFVTANGKEVFSYFDTENPIYGDGYFCVKPINTGTIELGPTKEDTSGLYFVPEDANTQLKQEEKLDGDIYSFNSEELTASNDFALSEICGYEDEKLYISAGGNGTYKISAEGNRTLRYYHTPIENGDKNAVITIGFADAAASYNIDRLINLSGGEPGWINLGTYNLRGYGDSSYVDVSIKGSGDGDIYIPQIMVSKASYEELEFSKLFYEKAENLQVLKVDSDIAFDKSNKVKLPDAIPEIKENRTFVPLRFVSELFGAEVSYNEQNNTARIILDGKEISVTPLCNYITVNGEKIQLDSSVYTKDGRMFVPLRAVSEAMEKKVVWNDVYKIILIADELKITENDSAVFEKFEAGFTK